MSEPGQGPRKELQVCSLEGPDWTEPDHQACSRSAEHCSSAVVASAADFVGVVSIAGLDQARGSVAAGCFLLPSAGVS